MQEVSKISIKTLTRIAYLNFRNKQKASLNTLGVNGHGMLISKNYFHLS